jgi:NADPH:quinone reductase
MPRAVRFARVGGPEVLEVVDADPGPPGPGEVRVRQTAVGVNFIDTYQRSGLYPVPSLPSGLGAEAAGEVELVGEGVREPRVGDRVAYATGPLGAYAEIRNVAAERLVVLPDGIDDRTAAAILLKGMTVEYLIRRTRPLAAGETVLLHAAAGGVGLIFCQWARALGARVIGTVSTEEKAALAREHGCAETILYGREDVVARVRELTGGAGVPVVYDSVGKDTFAASLDALAPRGMLVTFGQSSGAVPPFDVLTLSAKGSLYLTRPTLATYAARREDLLESARALFDVVLAGDVKVRIGQTFALADAAEAHRALEGRRTTGSTVLLP